MTNKEAMKLAMEALVAMNPSGPTGSQIWHQQMEAITALRQALANEALDKMAENARELGLDYEPAQQPVAWKWQQAPVKTQWGDEMVVASVAIDNDHTLSLYCERDQAPKVDAMFAQRTWVGLTDEEKQEWIDAMPYEPEPRHCMILVNVIEAKLKEKNT